MQQHGSCVIVTGIALRDLEVLCARGMQAIAHELASDGVTPPKRWREYLRAFVTARQAADELPDAEVAAAADKPTSRWLTTGQVAEQLGVTERQVRNIAQRLDGHHTRRGWMFDPRAIETEQRKRRKPS